MTAPSIWPSGDKPMAAAAFSSQWTPETVAQWHTLIRNRSGLSFDANRIGKLLEGIEDRQAACGVATLAEYEYRLHDNPTEFEALVSLLTVNETYFFRGIEELRLFADLLFPEFLHALRVVRPVSIVSAGCSSGEEAYSIAMLLLESQGNTAPFVVHGGDVDSQTLAIAQTGLYGENAFRHFDAQVRGRYFTTEPSGKERIAAHLQRKVFFIHLNLISSPYPPPLHGVDFIFYRNVSLYFDEATKKTIFARLMDHLTPGGCLFLSPAEIFFHNQPEIIPEGVDLEDRHGRFFFRKRGIQRGVVHPLEADQPMGAIGHPWVLDHSAAPDGERMVSRPDDLSASVVPKKGLAKIIRLAQEKRYEKALAHLDAYLQEEPAHLRATILKAAIVLHGPVDRTRLATVESLCRAVLATDPLCFDALVLLAMALRQAGGDPTTVNLFSTSEATKR